MAHYTEHKVKFLLRFHLIYHSDTRVDTTSGNRHHPSESIIRFVFNLLGVYIVESPMWMVFLYQTISVVSTQFKHATIVLPKKLDIFLSYIIVSPNMYKVHHHYKLPFTDSNYGNISVWDRIFSTFMHLKKEDIVYEIDTCMNPAEHNQLHNLLKIPFQEARAAKK